jgi:hypothetical protein
MIIMMAVRYFCGMFRCDFGCILSGCWFTCGVLDKIPIVGQVLEAALLCPSRCDNPPCGHGGGVRYKDLPFDPRKPDTDPYDDCKELKTGVITTKTCGYVTTRSDSRDCNKSSSTRLTEGCTPTNSTTTTYCSLKTVTDARIFCTGRINFITGNGTSTSSNTATSSTLVKACDSTGTTSTISKLCTIAPVAHATVVCPSEW